MSGGVDSSVAALLLKQQGWNVVGFTLCIPNLSGGTVETGEKAARVAAELDIPHFVVHAEEEFRSCVIAPFMEAYACGLTPNPCADCNKNIKFGLLMDVADELAGRPLPLATGHYARILRHSDGCFFARGRGEEKDQSYFLCDLPRELLCRLQFPLGEFTKDQVRALARESGMAVAEQAESMEVCFLSGDDYRNNLEAGSPGDIVDKKGTVLGRHKGIGGYTIGQRKGLGIAAPQPFYVLSINVALNEIVVGDQAEAYICNVSARRPNLLAPDRLRGALRGKTRSRASLSPCKIVDLTEGILSVNFAEPQFAPASGQRLVLYDEEDVLVASGVIV